MATRPQSLSEVEAGITRVVKILLATHNERPGDLARALEISPSSVSRSLNLDPAKHRQWEAEDVHKIAVHFSVKHELLFADEPNMWRLLAEQQDAP